MPVGTKATVKSLHPDEVRGARRPDPARQHLPPALPSRRRADPRARRPASLHGVGPARSSPTRAAFRSSRSATRSRASTTTASRSGASTTDARRASRPSSPRGSSATSAATSRCASTRCRAPDVTRRRARGSRAPHDRLGRAPARRCRVRTGSSASGSRQGGVDPELRRRSTEEIAELDFDGNAIGGLAIGEDRARCSRLTDWAAALLPAGQAALLHGHRRPGRDPRGDRGGRRHVRLRAADAHRPHRQRAHAQGPPQPAQRPLRARPGAARRRLRLPCLHALHARLHPPPRQPERAARAAPALAPQSTLPARADPPARATRSSAAGSAPTSAIDSKGSTWADS